MAENDDFFTQMRSLWSGMGVGQRIALIGSTVAVIAGLWLLVNWYSAAEYKMLYGGLSTEDAASIVEALQTDNVPYRITDGGKVIQVPSDRVYDVRLKLASQNIPQGGEVGYEIFDKFNFGMTSFAQRLNYIRALEGELTRTIRRMAPVEGARVHLVMPEKRLFEEQAEPTTASVVLKLKGNAKLAPKQVQSIVFLVSSSVEGLTPARVTVVDTAGNVLHQQADEDAPVALASNQLEYKTNFEKEVERRVRDMLERVFGEGSSVVRVSANFNFDRVEMTDERYDPEGQVTRSEERSSESASGGGSGPQGIPGVASNVGPGAEQARSAGTAGTNSSKESETINYEISRTVTKTTKTTGVLQKMSIAVAVDGNYKEAQGGAPKEFVPRSEEELAKIRSLVEKAAGIDPARGDQVEVTSIPFKAAEVIEEVPSVMESDLVKQIIKYGTFLIAALMFFIFLVRPLMKVLAGGGSARPRPAPGGAAGGARARAAGVGGGFDVTEGAPASMDQLEREMSVESASVPAEYKLEEKTPEETLKREGLKKRITEIVNQQPEEAAHLVRSWLTEPE